MEIDKGFHCFVNQVGILIQNYEKIYYPTGNLYRL